MGQNIVEIESSICIVLCKGVHPYVLKEFEGCKINSTRVISLGSKV